jgi:hypothetical protein
MSQFTPFDYTGGCLKSAVGPAALCVPQGGGVFSAPAKQWFSNRT